MGLPEGYRQRPAHTPRLTPAQVPYYSGPTCGARQAGTTQSNEGILIMKRNMPYGLVLALLIMTLGTPAGAALTAGVVPPELEPWQSWVLHGHEDALCPGRYNEGTAVRCQWPSQLRMAVSDQGGTFDQRWQIFAEGWAALPGGPGLWPESVVVNGQPAPVISRNNTPAVRLMPGEHRVMGRFLWQRMPETIVVPPALGLVALSIDGRTIPAPHMDDQGRLWLREGRVPDGREAQGTMQVQVYRLVDDAIPIQVTTLLRLDIAGMARKIDLDGALVPNSIPMSLESPLPARLDGDGRLTVQVRPGRWEVRVRARMPGPQYSIYAGACPHGDEIWSFQPRHALRTVEVADVPPVEPARTEMPAAWRQFPAYLMQSQGVMRIKEVRRGDPDPAPDQLFLHRTWWLDFDGNGFTVHDAINGTLSRQWFMAVNAPMVVGRVAVSGEDQVITEQGAENKMGVQLRRGRLALAADARLPQRSGQLSAVGWDHDFKSAAGVLQLPPGWRLLATSGVDQVSDTWLQRWSLLDLFLVLIIALAVFKLRGRRWGGLALAAMVLIFHEPNAPRLVWLHLLAVLAVVPLLPAGWFKRLVTLYGIGAMVVLLVLAVPFAVQQVRWGLYPQLAPREDAVRPMTTVGVQPPREMDASARPILSPKAEPRLAREALAPEGRAAPRTLDRQTWPHDPDALIPTGPGLPEWRWRAVELGWRGPVSKTQTIRLYLLSPGVNLALALMRVLLTGLLIWALIDWRAGWARLRPRLDARALVVLAALWVAGADTGPAQAEPSGFPPPALLEELRQRLLAKPDCLPDCADISRMDVVARGDELQVMLKVNSAARVAVPLPVNRQSWSPNQVLLNNAPIGGLARDADGQMWALVPEGLHTLVLLGSTSRETVIQMPLPLKPRTATYNVQGWRVDGIHADGSIGSSIQLTRLADDQTPTEAVPDSGMPPFLQVQRVLRLGLTWQVNTTVTRLTPTGAPIVLLIPLLAGESVTTEGIPVEEGRALVNLAPDQGVLTYTSRLETAPRVQLTAPRAVPWTEIWILDASPIWHCALEGIAVVHHQDAAGHWQPRWQPWPGEQVTIHVDRPRAVAGQLKTIDGAALELTPGQRFGRGALNMTVRTHRGGRHTLELPPMANLQQVTVNGQSLPVRQDGSFVTVPLQPGAQQIEVQWHQMAPFGALYKAPSVAVGQAAVNARVTVNMPGSRWILLAGGPSWGPAVLFWSYLAVVVLVAAGLGQLAVTPLKTWQWLLLGLGLTQVPAAMALLIVGWLVVLAFRARQAMPPHWLPFNAVQIALGLWTLAALFALFAAVKAGLLGMPDMQIAGNHSTHMALHWTQDRIAGTLPQPWVFSLPVWVFRVLMLAWSLWLALALLGWLKWGWQCMGTGGRWRKIVLRRSRQAPETSPGNASDG